MATDLGLGIDTSALAGYTASFGQVMVQLLMYGVLLAVVGFAAWYVWRILQFKHKVRIRFITGGKTRYIIDDRAKEFKEEGKVTFWKLLKTKRMIPIPPAEAINLGKNGKFHVECYYTDDEGFVPAKDSDALMKVHWSKDTETIDKPLDPLTTNQKLILINQIKKAQANRQQTLTELLFKMAPIIAIVIIMMVLFMFWSDITAPMERVSAQNAQVAKENARLLSSIEAIKFNIQTIESETVVRSTPPE